PSPAGAARAARRYARHPRRPRPEAFSGLSRVLFEAGGRLDAVLDHPPQRLLVAPPRLIDVLLAGYLGHRYVPPRFVRADAGLGVDAHDDHGDTLASPGCPQRGGEIMAGMHLDGMSAHRGGMGREVNRDDRPVEPARSRVATPQLVGERGRSHRALQAVD